MWIWLALAAANPPHPPTPDCGPDAPEACPADFGSWQHLSWIPEGSVDTVRPAERELGAGMSLDVAFRHTLGRWDVPVAILDSGIDWRERRLYHKVLLNTGELPPPQDASGTEHPYDLDGNGVVDLADYAEDPRVDAAAGNDHADDRLDPSDLIYTFSDGVDDDGNGYPDDIAGWDFFGWDNDPFAQLDDQFADHGTGMMKDAVGAADDGGDLGTCPNCSVIPVRVGDTFIVDGDRVALGIAYATDRGARAIGMSLGSITHGESVRDAIAYATDHDVVIAAAAGDENAYHLNVPGAEGPILYVHSVTADNRDPGNGAYSYFNVWNCNNYGPRVDFVASSLACASGATSQTAGAAALVFSMGLDAGTPLTGDEVRTLLRTTTDDVYLTEEERAISRAYPSKPGWDAFYGTGRLNVGAAVAAVAAGALPPAVEVTAPDWFAWPHGGTVAVTGRVTSRTGGVSWTLDLGRGAEPATWTPIASGDGEVDGVLGTIDLTGLETFSFGDLDRETVVDRMVRAHEPLVTVRLTATDARGRTAETRRAFWWNPDGDLLPGFPLDLRGSLEPSPVLADFDGDGVLEIVVATSGGAVHVLDGGGQPRPGFPVVTPPMPFAGTDAPALAEGALDPREGIVATPAVGDLDGDGVPEIVVATLQGAVLAWHADGTPVAGFPVHIDGRRPDEFVAGATFDNGIAAAPALGDVDGDGDLEVVVPGMDQRLYVWDGDGRLFDGYPLDLCLDRCGFRILASPALGDIDGDGDLDAALGTNEVPVGGAGVAWAIDLGTATPLAGWPVRRDGLINQTVLPVLGEGHPNPIALADLDGDGTLEIASNPMLGSLEILGVDGRPVFDLPHAADQFGDGASLDDGAMFGFATHPAFGDMDGDGVADLVLGGATPDYLASLAAARWVEFQHAVGAWSGATGAFLPGWPRQTDDVSFLHAPGIADVDGDGRPEAIHGTAGFLLYAWDADGRLADGWPKHTGGWIIGSPALGDIDGDGFLDVVTGTRQGYLFAWRTRGRADQAVQWAANHHDAANTGNWHTPLPVQAGPPEADPSCGCRSASGGLSGAGWLAVLVALRRFRRRASGTPRTSGLSSPVR